MSIMRIRHFAALAPVLVGLAGCGGGEGGVQSPQAILALMHRVNDYQQAHPRMKADDRNWERATWYTGVMQAWKATGDPRFFDQAMAWGRLHRWQVGTETCGANRLFCVQTWLELYAVKKDRSMVGPAVAWLATRAPNSPAGAQRWYLEGDHSYADSLYGAPALVMLANATGERKYLDICTAFWKDLVGELLDKDEGLFYRDRRFIGQRSPRGRKVLWSRGNGWVAGGLVRMLEQLPAGAPGREDYAGLLRTMAAALVRCQGADGMWRPNLADPEHIPVPESSGTGFFCYALAWGINNGVLDRKTYEPAVRKAWGALTGCVGEDGRVLWGQPVGDQPKAVQREQTHEYVTGTFLLAGAEMIRLARWARGR